MTTFETPSLFQTPLRRSVRRPDEVTQLAPVPTDERANQGGPDRRTQSDVAVEMANLQLAFEILSTAPKSLCLSLYLTIGS